MVFIHRDETKNSGSYCACSSGNAALPSPIREDGYMKMYKSKYTTKSFALCALKMLYHIFFFFHRKWHKTLHQAPWYHHYKQFTGSTQSYHTLDLFRLSILFSQYRSYEDNLGAFSCSYAVFSMNTTKVQTIVT